MKKIIRLVILCQFFWLNMVSAQGFIVSIANKVTANSKLTFDVNVKSTPGSGTICIDNCDFYFKYNNTYLKNPIKIVSGMGFVGTFGTDLSISIQGTGDHTDPSRLVSESGRLICTVQ